MAVPTPNQYWIRPDALTFSLNTPDVDYLRVSVLAGSAIIAYMEGVIDYDPSHNHRKWPIQAADTFLETTEPYYVHAQLTRSESTPTALIVYSLTKRSITGKIIEEDGTETGEEDQDYFYVYLGKISSSIDKNGQKVGRTWIEAYNPGKLDTNQGRAEDMDGHYLSKLFDDTARGVITFDKGVRFGNLLLALEGNDTLFLKNILTGEQANFAASGAIATKGIGTSSGSGGVVPWSEIENSIIPKVTDTYSIGTNTNKWKSIYAIEGHINSLVANALNAESIKLNGKDVATKEYVIAMVAQGGGGGGTGGSSTVSYLPTIEEGKEIGTLIVDGVSYGLFAPSRYSWDDIDDTPNFAAVAFSGSYNDLTNVPTFYTLTIQKNGEEVGTFTPNSKNATINIDGVVTLSDEQTITGKKTFTGKTTHNGGIAATSGAFSGLLSANGGIVIPSGKTLKIGNTVIEEKDGGLFVNGDLAASGSVATKGVGSSSGGGGNSYGRLDDWDNYDASKGDVLSALLGYGLKNDIVTLTSKFGNYFTKNETRNEIVAYLHDFNDEMIAPNYSTKSEVGSLADVVGGIGSRVSILEGKATAVSFAQTLQSGKQIGVLTIDGTATTLFAPAGYAWGEITSKPTTLAGYGITDAWEFMDNTNYVACNFRDSNLSQKAAEKYIEFWDGAGGWFNFLAGKYIVSGGTSSQFLKADGSLDNTAYLPLSGGIMVSGAGIYNPNDGKTYGAIEINQSHNAFGSPTFPTILRSSVDVVLNKGGVESTILHTGNYSSYALPLIGGELTGGLTIKSGNLIVNKTAGDTVTNALYPTADNTYVLGQNSRRWSDVRTVLINGGTPIHSGNIGSQSVASAKMLKSIGYVPSGGFDANTALSGGGFIANYIDYKRWGETMPNGMSYGVVYQLQGYMTGENLAGQLAWDVNHNGADSTNNLWWRANDDTGFVNAKWHQIAFTDSNVASANRLLASNGGYMVYQTSAGHLYVGDNIYGSGDTHILGKNIRFRYGTDASYGLVLNSSGNVTIGPSDLAGTTAKLYVDGSASAYYFKENTISSRRQETGDNWYTIYSANVAAQGDNVIIKLSHSYWNQITDSVILCVSIGYGNAMINQLSHSKIGSGAFKKVRIRKYENTYYVDVLLHNTVANTDMFFVTGSGKGDFVNFELVTSTDYSLIAEHTLSVGAMSVGGALSVGDKITSAGAITIKDTVYGIGATGVIRGSKLVSEGAIETSTLKVGGILIEDKDGDLFINGNVAASGSVATKGIGTSSSGGSGTIPWSALENSIIAKSTSYNLGSSAKPWGSVYADSIYMDDELVATEAWVNTKLGAAASYGIGYVQSGSNGLVTGNSVYVALTSYESDVLASKYATLANTYTKTQVNNTFAAKSEALIDVSTTIVGSRVVKPTLTLTDGDSSWSIDVAKASGSNVAITKYCVYSESESLMELSQSGDMWLNGRLTQSSDETLKNILSYNVDMKVKDIANAPVCYFTWEDRVSERQIGTIAQYWQLITPECVVGEEGRMSMDYSTLGLVSSIVNAREIVKHEDEIEALKRRVKELEDKLAAVSAA